MTFALNKIALWLATLVVAGLMLLVSSIANAHTVPCHDPSGRLTAPSTPGAEFLVSDRAELVVEPAPSSERNHDPHSSPHTSCCGIGVSGCSAGAMMQAPPVLLPPLMGAATASFDVPALKGAVVDRLIRPPRAVC